MSNHKKEAHGHQPDSLEVTEDVIRNRAYQLFEERGCEHGYDLEDWLQAEAEIMAKKPGTRAELNAKLHKSVAA